MSFEETPLEGIDRYRLLERLGAGGMGVVYVAHDLDRDEVVALKTLLWADASAIYRLKNEFRALADLSHPNLVTLYELVGDAEHWFFTMELVAGQDFRRYVRPERLDEGRLRRSLAQLAEGIAFIHAAGKLHRDLKPSNVLVTGEGRVVLLDFGIASDIAATLDDRATHGGLMGTIGYMAPEQIDGAAGPASDWYALGIMLYEALGGGPAFTGTPLQILAAKQTMPPPPPEVPGEKLPRDLLLLCRDLLAIDPDRRPSGEEVLRRLMGEEARVPLPITSPPPATGLIGRDRELAELRAAFRSTSAGSIETVFVSGPSGIGKSALVGRFLEELQEQQAAVVLTGRCYIRESMPYKAFDGVMDSLGRFLRRLPPETLDALLDRDLVWLGRLFPALARLEEIAKLRAPGERVRDPVQLRREGFAALKRLLLEIRSARPLVIHIDDLQWGDRDSVILLEYLRAPPDAPPILLIASFRSDEVPGHPFLASLAAQAGRAGCREIRLDALSREETVALARRLIGSDDLGALESVIVEESGGSPFLVEQLARYVLSSGPRDGDAPAAASAADVVRGAAVGPAGGWGAGPAGLSVGDMLDARIAGLPETARPFLETLAVAGRPIPLAVARDAAGLREDERPLVTQLRADNIVHSSGDIDRIEFYHDRLREAIARRVEPDRLPRIHLRLARFIEAHEIDDPEALYEHYLEGGQPERAVVFAKAAGAKAMDALAFERAGRFYKRALELEPASSAEVPALRRRLADAWASAGRAREAADTYLLAARESPESEAVDLRRRAAEQLLRGGHLDDGMRVLVEVLDAVGLKLARTPRHAVARILRRRAFLRLRSLRFRRREAEEIDARLLQRIDVCWAVAIGLARIDTVRAMDFQTLGLLLSLRAGEPYRATRAIAAEASFTATAGHRARQRALKLAELANRLAADVARPEAEALARFATGLVHFWLGRFGRAREECDVAERLMRLRCTGLVWERNTAQTITCSALVYLGDFAELGRLIPGRLREAREHGDLYATADASAGRPVVVWLARDDPGGAREAVRDAMRPWTSEGFHLQHYFALLAESQIDLYEGLADGAWDRLSGAWAMMERSKLFRTQVIRVEAKHLRARCALAAAGSGRLGGGLEIAERMGEDIRAEGVPWAAGLGSLVLSAVRHGAGDRGGALALGREALAELEACGLRAYEAAAARRLGDLLGGAEGDEMLARSRAWMEEQKIAAPTRLVRMLAPGFEAPASGT